MNSNFESFHTLDIRIRDALIQWDKRKACSSQEQKTELKE
jgi:hypothetical protein